jgi:hypothetical protein
LLVSRVKGESFLAQILQETYIYFQDSTAKMQFLLFPEAGTNLFGRDLMVQLGIGLHVKRDKIQASLSLLTPWAQKQIKPIIWAREGNRGSLQVTPIKVQLKKTGVVVRRKQYPILIERRKGLKSVIKGLIKDRLLEPCMSPFNTPILPVKKTDGSYQLVQNPEPSIK